ncbi:unnamed protein product, partial [Staurois parvus]
MSPFVILKFPAVPSPYVPTLAGDGIQMTDDGITGHYRGHCCRRDIAGAQDNLSIEQIPEQCRMVSPSVARGYRLCYTREYLQGG